jgi:adenine deaminase
MPVVDLLITGGRILNVFTGELEETALAIAGGRVVGLGDHEARERLDAGGRILLPGFCEGHIHIESTLLTPATFAQAVAPHGTTTVVADPHEIGNVAGLAGVRWLAEAAPPGLLDLHVMAPSCVPATPFETSGAEIRHEEIAEMLRWPQILGLGEVMNYPGVIGGDPEVLAKLRAAQGRPIDGHAPGVTGKDLMAYIAAGPNSDHESVSLAEGQEKLQRGMWLMAREGSASRNLEALAPLLCGPARGRCLLVSDDLEPGEVLARGHLDYRLREAVRLGVAPLDAVRAVTINVALRFGLQGIGALGPGHAADVVIVGDLQEFRPWKVFKGGREIAPGQAHVAVPAPDCVMDSVRLPDVRLEDLKIAAPGGADAVSVAVIVAQDGLIVTERAEARLAVVDGGVAADPAQDVLKLAVIERHGRNGNIGLGLVRGFGLQSGALASTVAHDSHNLIVVGADDASMLTAIAAVRRMRGGLVAAAGERVLAELPLPVGGLMSEAPVAEVAAGAKALREAARGLGGKLSHPFMALSFLALPVIPHLKLTDQGLFDVDEFGFTSLLR